MPELRAIALMLAPRYPCCRKYSVATSSTSCSFAFGLRRLSSSTRTRLATPLKPAGRSPVSRRRISSLPLGSTELIFAPTPSLDEHAHGLDLRVHLDAHSAVLAAQPSMLVSAERHVRVDGPVRVDPYRAGSDLRHEPMNGFEVVRPDARAEAIGRVVGERGDLVEVVETLRDEHGPEDLF